MILQSHQSTKYNTQSNVILKINFRCESNYIKKMRRVKSKRKKKKVKLGDQKVSFYFVKKKGLVFMIWNQSLFFKNRWIKNVFLPNINIKCL